MALPIDGGVSGRKRLTDAQGCTETHRVAQIRTKSHKISQTRTRSHRFDQKRTMLLKKLGQGYFCPKNGVIDLTTEAPLASGFLSVVHYADAEQGLGGTFSGVLKLPTITGFSDNDDQPDLAGGSGTGSTNENKRHPKWDPNPRAATIIVYLCCICSTW